MIWERIGVVCAGFLLDLVLGDPEGIWHPVQGIGALISGLESALRKVLRICPGREEDRAKKRAAGMVLVVLTLAGSVGIPVLLLIIAKKIHPLAMIFLEILFCYQMLAVKSLKTASMEVCRALERGDIPGARRSVARIVGRDTDCLDRGGITKAAVETVAENTSDGVIAPLFYMLLFGPLGGIAYKAVNTMDSMIGYQNDAYCYFGTAAAKLDDLLNFIPARLAALSMILASFVLGLDGKNALRIFCRDRYCHASPNSAQTESVCAGALRVQLAGDARYFGQWYKKPVIGDPLREIEPEDIRRANRLLYGSSWTVLLLGTAALLTRQIIGF